MSYLCARIHSGLTQEIGDAHHFVTYAISFADPLLNGVDSGNQRRAPLRDVRYFLSTTPRIHLGLTGFDSKPKRYVSMQSTGCTAL